MPTIDTQKHSSRGGKIVMHTPEPSEGAALYVARLVIGIAELGANITLFCPGNFDHIDEVRASGAQLALTSIRDIRPAGKAARIWRNLRYIADIARLQAKVTSRGDIVHFQFPIHFPAGLVSFALAKIKGCPIVYTAHDPIPHRWFLPPWLRWLDKAMLQLAYNMSTRIVVHNRSGRKILIEQFGQSERKIDLIAHGTYVVPVAGPTAPEGKFRVLLFGGIRQNKGIHLAIEAVQQVNRDSPMPVHMTIAGTLASAREKSYWQQCLDLIAKDPAPFEVLLRYVEDAELGPMLMDYHALLLPYINYTSESGVAALALSNRRPLIATRGGGLGELLEGSDCGIAIEEATVEGVAAALRKALAAGPEGLARKADIGAEYVIATRSWPAVARLTLEAYEKARV